MSVEGMELREHRQGELAKRRPGPEAREIAEQVAGRIEDLWWASWRDRLEGGTQRFTMEALTFACGSPACIAGWTVYLVDGAEELARRHRSRTVQDRAGELLEIGAWDLRSRLFAPEISGARIGAAPGSEEWISGERAAMALRHYAGSGEIVWNDA